MTACGWIGKFGLKDVLDSIESQGDFERSAALAVWNSDLGEAVSALQRGAENVRARSSRGESSDDLESAHYAETLELVAMCKCHDAKECVPLC